ncbi:MAG: DUF362 domain-containing protein [Candidatus Omnitrophica bacterium]|nr:DUF362 domain-containing protein [Candidatus Omnitrophota bacterium]
MSKVYFVPADKEEGEKILVEKTNSLIKKSGILDEIKKDDFAGIKLHFGEKENSGFIRPSVVKEVGRLCKAVSDNVTMVETNTIYAGERSNSISHLKLAYSHGFGFERTELPAIIADGPTGRDFVSVDINKKHVKEAKVASGIMDLDVILGLAHVTGHCQTGLGASIKNIGMGCASRAGKLEQHSTVLPEVTADKCIGCGLCIKWCPANAIKLNNDKAAISKEACIGCGECTVACRTEAIEIKWNESVQNLQEKMAEYAYAALRGKKRGFLNFLMKITKDCDCMAKENDPSIVSDIGILASKDPVSIDKATIDLLNNLGNCDRLKDGYPNIDWNIQVNYAAKIGLGSLDYELINI